MIRTNTWTYVMIVARLAQVYPLYLIGEYHLCSLLCDVPCCIYVLGWVCRSALGIASNTRRVLDVYWGQARINVVFFLDTIKKCSLNIKRCVIKNFRRSTHSGVPVTLTLTIFEGHMHGSIRAGSESCISVSSSPLCRLHFHAHFDDLSQNFSVTLAPSGWTCERNSVWEFFVLPLLFLSPSFVFHQRLDWDCNIQFTISV